MTVDDDRHELTEGRHGISPDSGDAGLSNVPTRIGRYRIERVLGTGGFGLVYLAVDEQLGRSVALKVPHAALVSRPEDAEPYLAEARTVANLDHPHIVPVYDVGTADDIPCYVVCKYVDGTDLASALEESRFSHREAAELVATIAEALHHAHELGLVHRDVKPSNILIGNDGKCHIVDFGLALREENIGKGPKQVGTTSYMSPEQARGEGHRVDRRSDIFSLGVVFYQLLTGRRPFRADTRAELLERITSAEPRPPRRYEGSIPRELERICQRAISKRASERYATAQEMADDLRHFLRQQPVPPSSTTADVADTVVLDSVHATPVSDGIHDGETIGPIGSVSSGDRLPVQIIPKGLRSFDEHDADFFLELLPGPRDRDGLPDSIRFWKARIEEADPDNTFSVGLIYGASGCGKSSLVRAGLLPRLPDNVISVYIEATPDETESRLARGLKRRFPSLDLDLKEMLAALRRGQGFAEGKKLLIVIDQFEQWLHARKETQDAELVQALRQCDGGRVQCMIMVRDDFWLAVTRFMSELEVSLVEGQNTALADLFDLRHARKVLAAFGRAFGTIQAEPNAVTKEQQKFLTQAIDGLQEDNKVAGVRLALFAEMIKGRPWTAVTLREMGGAAGVGVTFLEETFASQAANPNHRLHEEAARAVLQSLLPPSGTSIKGQIKSYGELLEASGYARRPSDFDQLIKILDSELRLITPTDPGRIETTEGSESGVSEEHHGEKYYQLTHDYLVHSLRDWLTRKQKETRRGRAKLRLAERASLWDAKPESRYLPSAVEYVSIGLCTPWRSWTAAQRKMMTAATWYYGLWSAFALLLFACVTLSVARVRDRVLAEGLVTALLIADLTEVPQIVESLADYRRIADDMLRAEHRQAGHQSSEKLKTALALLPADASQVDYLLDRMLNCQVDEFEVLRTALGEHQTAIGRKLWEVLHGVSHEDAVRLRAGMALAAYQATSPQWTDNDGDYLADQLLTAIPEHWRPLRRSLSPIKARLVSRLRIRLTDEQAPSDERDAAAAALADYLSDDAHQLALLACLATASQYRFFIEQLVRERPDKLVAKATLAEVAGQQPAVEWGEVRRVLVGRQRAAAAATLMRMGDLATAQRAFDIRDDPEALTQFVHACRNRGVTVDHLLVALDQTEAVPARFAILLALGEYGWEQIPEPQREQLAEQFVTWYETDPSSAIHGACGWLLRRWGFSEEVRRVDETPLSYDPTGVREWYVQEIEVPGETASGRGQQRVYFTFIVFQPGEYLMGSPADEQSRFDDESQHRVVLTRPLAISDREVTWRQVLSMQEMREKFAQVQGQRPNSEVNLDHPATNLTWYDAVRVCRWLSRQARLSEEDQSYSSPELPAEIPTDAPSDATGPGDRPPENWLFDPTRPGFRLPTDAEWENVCRGGLLTSYGFGSDRNLLAHYGWHVANSDERPHAVAELRPSLRGLFDLHGNVYEWCHDWYAEQVNDSVDPLGPAAGFGRVIRGGSWRDSAGGCRSAHRAGDFPVSQGSVLGFRVARTLPLQSQPGSVKLDR